MKDVLVSVYPALCLEGVRVSTLLRSLFLRLMRVSEVLTFGGLRD